MPALTMEYVYEVQYIALDKPGPERHVEKVQISGSRKGGGVPHMKRGVTVLPPAPHPSRRPGHACAKFSCKKQKVEESVSHTRGST